MRTITRCIAAWALLCWAGMANATLVNWEFRGTLDSVTNQPGLTAGDPFRVIAQFDTNAALVNTRSGSPYAPGNLYEYDYSAVSLRIYLGGLPVQLFSPGPSTVPQNFLWLRDNSNDRAGLDGFGPSDGLSIGLSDNLTYLASIVLRGTNDVFTGSALPSSPDPLLLGFQTRGFTWFIPENNTENNTARFSEALGTISQISRVPEPGTLLLIGLGLAGFGTVRRRRG